MTARARPAAAAAFLAAALGLVSCGSGSRHRAVPSTATPTPPAPSSTIAPPASSSVRTAPGPYDWTRAASPALAIGGGASSALAAVVTPAGGGPWIVAGARLGTDGSSTATVWTSADGVAWRATALTGPQVDSQANAATSWHGGTVVVGSVGRGADSRAAVWVSSTAGTPYVQVPVGALDSVAASGSVMTSVSGGALGLFAAGTENGHVALWYSSNGHRWTELTAAERVIGSTADPHIQTVLAGLEGDVYAAGWERSGPSIVAAVWASNDGINWHRAQSARTAFAGPGDHLITSLAPFGTGLVAVGGIRTGSRWEPASWISPNGDSWSQPSLSFALGAPIQPDRAGEIVRGVNAVATGVHAAVLTAVGGGPTAQRLWTSTDGLHWSELAFPPAAAAGWRASLIGVAGSTAVVADADPGQPHLLVRRATRWLEPSSNAAMFGAVQPVARPAGLAWSPSGLLLAVEVNRGTQAIGPNSSSLEFLSSFDGTTWVPVPTPQTFTGSRIEALAAVPGGFLAAGWTSAGSRRRASIWISPDGRSWTPSLPLDPRPIAASDQASGICVDGAMIAVVGRVQQGSGDAARAWISGDARHWTVATLGPAAAVGVSTAMTGCTTHPTGISGADRLDAFGTMSAPGSEAGPAYWSAEPPTVWTRDNTTPFGSGFPFPAVDVARTGTLMLAAASEPDGDGLLPSLEPTGVGSSSLWRSADSGASWQRLDTPAAPWLGAEATRFNRVAWLGPTPVVAGVVDGRLAVWTGTFNG